MMKQVACVSLILALVALASATVYFDETFDNSYASRWVVSENKDDLGRWDHSAGRFYRDAEDDKGLQTAQDYRFYQISSAFEAFSNEGETLVLQFSVKHEQNLGCGGGYIKLMPAGTDQKDFGGDSPYFLMFGPDICGTGTRRVHAIVNYKDENHLIKETVKCETDTYTHVYTWIINPDQTYSILIDNDVVQTGSLTEDWDVLPPRQVPDPTVSKPDDWVDRKQIPDPEARKPEDWDAPKTIADPEASQPEDWDEELDGEWEVPQVPNPEYKGFWRAPMIDNPEYQGEWVHPLVDNPEYVHDDAIYAFSDVGVVGIEIWQVEAGSIFDNILVTNDVDLAAERAEQIMLRTEVEREQQAEEVQARAAKEAEERARLEEEFGDLDDEEEEEEGHGHNHDEL